MAGAITDTTLGEILLNVYEKGRVEQLQNITSPVLGSMTKAANYSLGGATFIFGVNAEGDERYGYIAENAGLPTASVETVRQLQLDPKIFVGQVTFTGLARAISMRDEHSFVSAIQYNADQKLQRMTAYKEGVVFRTGTGRLALQNGALSGDTATVDTGNVMWFRPGMLIDSVDTLGGVLDDGLVVESVDFANQTVTFTTTPTTADNDAFFPDILGQTTYAGAENEAFGLDYFIKTSGTTLNEPLATTPALASNVIAAAGAAITEDILLQAENRILVVGGVPLSSIRDFRCIWHPNQRRKYFRLVQAQKQYTSLNLDAGYRTLTWNGHEALESYNCPETSVYMGDWSQFQHFVTPGGEMQLDTTFGPVVKWETGFDNGVMYYRSYDNYALRKPNAMARIENLENVTSR